jgi:hypothetical protein
MHDAAIPIHPSAGRPSMISPEDSARFAHIKEGYREWLERARRESDERRAAVRRPLAGGRRAGDPPASPDPMGGERR